MKDKDLEKLQDIYDTFINKAMVFKLKSNRFMKIEDDEIRKIEINKLININNDILRGFDLVNISLEEKHGWFKDWRNEKKDVWSNWRL